MFDFAVNSERYHLVIYVLYNVEFFFAINIGNVLMSSMGKLAVDLSHSVREMCSDVKKSFFFCTLLNDKCKRVWVNCISLGFFVCAAYLVIYGCVK
jgi:hypothetical protein